MNTVNNKRKRNSIEKIESSLMKLLENKELKDITVTDICSLTKINRSTFYTNYIDISNLASSLSEKLEKQIIESLKNEKTNKDPLLNLFTHIYNNKKLYIAFFKLSKDKKINFNSWGIHLSNKLYDDFFTDYHTAFFECGINGIINKWIEDNFSLTIEELNEIIKNEYKSKTI